MKKLNSNQARTLLRYGIIVMCLLILSALIVYKMFSTTIINHNAWNERAEKTLNDTTVISPIRGSILACDGSILACNLELYDISMDLRHPKIMRQKQLNWASIDSLADSLDRYFPRRPNLTHPDSIEKYSWNTALKKAFEKDPKTRTRVFRLVNKGTLEDFYQIKSFPFIRDFGKNNTPLYKEVKNIRMYPYGNMAKRSIGRINIDTTSNRLKGFDINEVHGYSGLEKDLDTLLYGKPGLARKLPLMSGVTDWVYKPAQRGYDIRTTIDIDIQDILEEELLKICQESNAEWGTAIIMEVATGEIRAISNLEKGPKGNYIEALNRAVTGFEPGSVMKPLSLMIAFEDGLVSSVNQTVDCSPFQRTSDPHAPRIKNMKQVIEMSSNTGIARVIFRGYKDDPAKFHDRLASIGFFDKMNSGIADEELPRIRKLLPQNSKGKNITMTARHLDLARQAYGYNTAIPPLYMLSIYNAIANDGKYVRPHLVHSLIDENGKDSVIPIDYIRERICSPETARKVRECIREVVWGKHGTARKVQDDRVEIAGKTGTAYPHVKNVGYDKSKRRYAFAGFFPYDNPRYSCMALVLASAGTSANRTSGQVVKNVALKLYSRGMLNNTSSYSSQTKSDRPTFYASTSKDGSVVKNNLNIKGAKQFKSNGQIADGKMPDVKGYDITSAINILEKSGLKVVVKGNGYVAQQSIPAGNKIKKGQTVTLTLKI